MIFILMVFCCDLLVKKTNAVVFMKNKIDLKTIILIFVLLLGAVTPMVEISRGIVHAILERRVPSAYDPIYSFDRVDVSYNFSSSDYSQKFFFKYIADR